MTEHNDFIKTVLIDKYGNDGVDIAGKLQLILESKYDMRVNTATSHNDWLPDRATLLSAYREFAVSEVIMLKTVETFRPIIENKEWPIDSSLGRRFLMHCRMHLTVPTQAD